MNLIFCQFQQISPKISACNADENGGQDEKDIKRLERGSAPGDAII
jgi:hypothetical protein